MERPEPWENPDPERYHFEPVESEGDRWRLWARGQCRYIVGPRASDRCPCPGAAQILRGNRWWNYCEDHLYGRWIEDGKIMQWRLIENDREVSR